MDNHARTNLMYEELSKGSIVIYLLRSVGVLLQWYIRS